MNTFELHFITKDLEEVLSMSLVFEPITQFTFILESDSRQELNTF